MSLGRTIPALPVADVAAAVECYGSALGFTVVHAVEDFAVLQRDDAIIHLWLAGSTSWRRRLVGRHRVRTGAESFLAGTASCRIETTDVDAMYAEMSAAGVLHPASRDGVIDTDHGTREVNVLDVDGNLVTFFS